MVGFLRSGHIYYRKLRNQQYLKELGLVSETVLVMYCIVGSIVTVQSSMHTYYTEQSFNEDAKEYRTIV